jgi:ABC-type lipoprotein release transport system permease subunit
VGPVRRVVLAERRRRWPSWAAAALLVALVGGLTMAAATAARRTADAYPSFVRRYGFDAAVFSLSPTPQVARLPEVAHAVVLPVLLTGQPTCACPLPINAADVSVDLLTPALVSRLKLLSGRLPRSDEPHEALISFTLQHDEHLHLGSRIRVPLYTREQAEVASNETGAAIPPAGPVVTERVVGIEASDGEFPAGAAPSYNIYASPALGHLLGDRVGMGAVYAVRLRRGAADLPRLAADSSGFSAGMVNTDQVNELVESSIRPQATGWWVLAVLGALVGLVILGQTLARQSVIESEDFPTLAAVGFTPRQLVQVGILRNALIAVVGAVGAVILALALSPLTPVGEARIAEPSTGLALDWPVAVVGLFATVAAVLLLGLWPAIRASHTLRRDSTIPRTRARTRSAGVVTGIAAFSGSPSALIGVRHVVRRGEGREALPVRTAMLGSVLAMGAIAGTAVFGASLSHLTATPALYGDPFQLNFSVNGGQSPPGLLSELGRDPHVVSVTQGVAVELSIRGHDIGAIAGRSVRGPLLLSRVSGRLPSRDGQIALGNATMREVGARVGSIVNVTVTPTGGRPRTVPFRVVGSASFPVLSGTSGLGSGAMVTLDGYESAACAHRASGADCRQAVEQTADGGLLVSVTDDPGGRATLARYRRNYVGALDDLETPTSLVNFGEAVNFPAIFAAGLAIFGAATVAHVMMASVSRRRRELGLLKALGFSRGQVARSVTWQASVLVAIGAIIGVPIGMLVGRAVWVRFATGYGVVPVVSYPFVTVAVLSIMSVLVVNLLAVLPARRAARAKPGELLRGK